MKKLVLLLALLFSSIVASPASAGTLLQRYETGTFTPALKFGGNSVGMTYDFQTGSYTRIGRLVCVQIDMHLTAKGSSTGVATITGLPYTSNAAASIFSWFILDANSVGSIMPIVTPNATTIDLQNWSASTFAQMVETNFNNGTYLRLSGCYTV